MGKTVSIKCSQCPHKCMNTMDFEETDDKTYITAVVDTFACVVGNGYPVKWNIVGGMH